MKSWRSLKRLFHNWREGCKWKNESFRLELLALGSQENILKKGVDENKLPQSVDGYREMIRKYLLIHNGKLLREFDKLYRLLHIAGFYRGHLEDVAVVKDAIKAAKHLIH